MRDFSALQFHEYRFSRGFHAKQLDMDDTGPQPTTPTASPVAVADWNALWQDVHDTLYDVLYQEFVLEALLERWERASAVCRFVVVITTPGSAIAGWALWTLPGFKHAWVVLAGIAALFAVAESVLAMNDRIKEHTILLTDFRSLRVDVDTFRIAMRIKALDCLADYKKAYIDLRARFSKAEGRTRNDLWFTKTVQELVQERLNTNIPRP